MASFDNKKIIDISLLLYNGMITYPNNEPFSLIEHPRQSTRLSSMTLGTHSGTHIDAPVHTQADLGGVDSIDLAKCIGTCRVLDCTHCHKEISQDDLMQHGIQKGERILCRTNNSERGYDQFYDDYVALSGDAADWLADQGILLFGIDFLSIKKSGDADTRPHTSLLQNDIIIVEGLNLKNVSAGIYDLVILPLKIKDGDGAPSRAILIEKDNDA